MADSPTARDFDPDEDLFSFDEVATDVFATDDEDLDEIFASFRVEEEEALAEVAAGRQAAERIEVATAEPTFEPTPKPSPPSEPMPPEPTVAVEPPAPPAPRAAPAVPVAPSDPPPSKAVPTPPPAARPAPVQAQPSPELPAPASVAPTAAVPGAVTFVLPPLATKALALFREHRTAALILLAVTLVNSMLAFVRSAGPAPIDPPIAHTGTADPGRGPEGTPAGIAPAPRVEPSYPEAVVLLPVPVRNHPGLERAREEILAGSYAAARQRIYGLLAIVDRMDADQREPLEARAQFLLAEALHLEAVHRMEASR